MGSAIRNAYMPTHLTVPERYNRNQFTAGCFTYIKMAFVKSGGEKWLTYKEFIKTVQEANLRQCREGIFEEVLNKMKTDRMLGHDWSGLPKEHPAQETTNELRGLPKQHEKFIKDGATNLGDAIVEGLKKAQTATLYKPDTGPKREPVSEARRSEAADWVKGHINEGYAVFKNIFTEPEFETSWFNAARAKCLNPQANGESMGKELVFNARTGEEVRKIAKYLLPLQTDRIKGITRNTFVEKTGNTVVSTRDVGEVDKWVMSARRIVLAHLEAGGSRVILEAGKASSQSPEKPPAPPATSSSASAAPAAAQAPASAPAPRAMPKGAFVVLAEIPMEDFKDCPPASLKKFAELLVENLHERGKKAQVRMMSDPAAMEIRVPAA